MAGIPKLRSESAPVVISDWQRQKEVAELAYQFWRARRFRNGSPEEDLLRADRELRERAETPKMGSLFLVRKRGTLKFRGRKSGVERIRS